MIGGWPAPADSSGVARGRPALNASGAAVLPRWPASALPLTLTRCNFASLTLVAARICTDVVPPVQIGSPTCRSVAGRTSGPWPFVPAETQLLQRPSRPRKRNEIFSFADPCHSTPTRSAGEASSKVATIGASAPSRRWASAGDGDPPSSASAVRGRRTPLPSAPAEATSNDLRVIRRALIASYDTTRPAQVAPWFVRIH